MKNVHITTLGCSKNVVDSEVLAGQLKLNKYKITEDPESADVIIINTCGFIEDAKKESIQAIFEAVEIKKTKKNTKVFVAGCLSQRYFTEIKNDIPEIDEVFGTEDYQNILKKLGTANYDPDKIYNYRELSTPRHFAYLKISEGCNHTCSFCAIPGIRGKHRSRSIDDILFEAEKLAGQGIKELILVSQDTSYFGKDLYGSQKMPDLIEQIAAENWFEWIRPLYWYPSNFPLKYIDLMGKYKSVIPYLDMPVQHASNKMLKLMRRAETNQSLIKLYKDFRSKLPEIALRTTLIVGHPGETNEDFEILKAFIQEIEFDRLGAFVYSDEENTHAFNLADKVEPATAIERYNEIMQIQKDISLKKNSGLIDTIQIIMIDSYDPEGEVYVGRSYRDAPEIDNEIIVSGMPFDIRKIGRIFPVEINDYSEYELYGNFRVLNI